MIGWLVGWLGFCALVVVFYPRDEECQPQCGKKM